MRKLYYTLTRKMFLVLLKWLESKKMVPFRTHMGSSSTRMTIGRKYVEKFIQDNIGLIEGDILEIGRNVYYNSIRANKVVSYSCLDIEFYPDIDIVADIQNMPHVLNDSFDTIICTQVLEHVKNPFLAIKELHRILRPGGTLLITVPFLNNYHMEPHDYWRFTEFGLNNLLNNFSRKEVVSFGSTFEYVAATMGFSYSELESIKANISYVPHFPIIVASKSTK